MPRTTTQPSRRVVIFALPGAFSLDILGAYEIFDGTGRLLAFKQRPETAADPSALAGAELAYEVQLVAADPGPLSSWSSAQLVATDSIANVRGPVDTFIVAGGDITRMLETLRERPELKTAIRRIAKRARRVASVCTGAFVLAEAGLLGGKRATTHWAACDLLQQQYPTVEVERGPIFTQDGNIYTSAGASTGMDLSLALVREDHGAEVAREIARWLVLYMERPGGQSQLSVPLQAQVADRRPIAELQHWIAEHFADDVSVSTLARRVGMSVRNFARAYKHEIGVTPASYVESLRVEAARRKLEQGTAALAEVASQVGFGSVDTLRRAFVRQTGQLPSETRQLLNTPPNKSKSERRLRVVQGSRGGAA